MHNRSRITRQLAPSRICHPNNRNTLNCVNYQLFWCIFQFFFPNNSSATNISKLKSMAIENVMVQWKCPNTSVIFNYLILIICNWLGYHYVSLFSNWQNFAACLVYCMKWTAILGTLSEVCLLVFWKKDLYLVITQKLIFWFTQWEYPDKTKEKHTKSTWKAYEKRMKSVRFLKDHLQGIVTLCFLWLYAQKFHQIYFVVFSIKFDVQIRESDWWYYHFSFLWPTFG